MKYSILFLALALTGCDPSTSITNSEWEMPSDLRERGCDIVSMQKGGGSSNTIHLIRCKDGLPPEYLPQISTRTSQGRTERTDSVILF